MMPEHCGSPMMQIYERVATEDRYEMALTIETHDALHQCMRCGAKLSTHLEQPLIGAPFPDQEGMIR